MPCQRWKTRQMWHTFGTSCAIQACATRSRSKLILAAEVAHAIRATWGAPNQCIWPSCCWLVGAVPLPPYRKFDHQRTIEEPHADGGQGHSFWHSLLRQGATQLAIDVNHVEADSLCVNFCLEAKPIFAIFWHQSHNLLNCSKICHAPITYEE